MNSKLHTSARYETHTAGVWMLNNRVLAQQRADGGGHQPPNLLPTAHSLPKTEQMLRGVAADVSS